MRYVNDAIKRKEGPRDERINRIIELEWNMFDQVTNTGGRAACQDDEWTFYVMRFSQFASFSEEMLESYEQDLLHVRGGRIAGGCAGADGSAERDHSEVQLHDGVHGSGVF